MIIGITGTIGAGKGTLVEYLKTHGFAHYSSSGILTEILSEQGILTTRENLSSLANELRAEHSGGIAEVAYDRAIQAGETNFIIESLHRVAEAEFIQSKGGIIMGVDADLWVRYERISKRKEGQKDSVSFEQFAIDAAREDDGATGSGPNIRAVLKLADYTIFNNGSIEEFKQKIEVLFKEIQEQDTVE